MLLFLLFFEYENKKILAHLESFQIDLSLRVIKFFDNRFQFIASSNKNLSLSAEMSGNSTAVYPHKTHKP